MNFHSDVCVIGNGAIGKATALGLTQAGLSVSLLVPPSVQMTPVAPPTSAAEWDVRVYAINQGARDLLSSMKVWDALDHSRVAPVDAMSIEGDGASGRGKLTFDAYSARANELAWIVEDANLNHALDTALKFAANLRLVSACAVGLNAGADNALITLEGGDSLTASLVVGADGGQSWVRSQMDIGIDYRPYHQRAIVTNFNCEKPHRNLAHQWFTSSEGIVALLPMPGNRVSLVWSAPEKLAEVILRESMLALARRVSALPGQPLGNLTPLMPEVRKAFPLALLRPHEIIAPRVALVGDAAHVVHPMAGQGMNLGFADVAMLIKAVRERGAQHDCGDARVLGRYARSRKEDILLMQLATDGLERLFSIDLEPVRFLRNAGLSWLDKLPGMKRHLISQAFGKSL